MAQTAANHPTGTNSPQAASTASGISSNRTSQTAMTASSAGSPADGKIDWKAQKEEQARLRKRQNELKKLRIRSMSLKQGMARSMSSSPRKMYIPMFPALWN